MDKRVEMRPATALIATPETDEQIAERERRRGMDARIRGLDRGSCPWSAGSLTGKWWHEGYDWAAAMAGDRKEKLLPPGKVAGLLQNEERSSLERA